jgi:hypothetical protein
MLNLFEVADWGACYCVVKGVCNKSQIGPMGAPQFGYLTPFPTQQTPMPFMKML